MTIFDSTCIPCMLNQSLTLLNKALPEKETFKQETLISLCRIIAEAPSNITPPHITGLLQERITIFSGISDPYASEKEENLHMTLRYAHALDEFYRDADNKLEAAIRIAIAGNSIDVGANPNFNIALETGKNLFMKHIDPVVFEQFGRELLQARNLLYIADNFEEAVFDKYLITQMLPKKVFFAVRSKPILNDITFDDALSLGLDKICTIIESGSTIPGTDIEQCNEEFTLLFNSVDMVIAKGQGNFETLHKCNRSVFFMFKVKCMAIARHLDCEIGKSVLLCNKGN